jgi:Zn-finger nucleic acid-binding protein
MDAETINCPMCGAATSIETPRCQYCEAILATIACPSCFAMMFIGSKHCPHCGAAAVQPKNIIDAKRKCPRCRIDMRLVEVGDSKVLECSTCLGLWLTTAGFEKLCSDKEQQSAVLGNPTLTGVDRHVSETKVNYVPCPQCTQLMNRANFARCSGVIIDLCKQHGIWFDRNELSRIVEFIRAGGLEMSRTKEKLALEAERRQLHQERVTLELQQSGIAGVGESDRVAGIASTSGLLKFLLG